MVLCDHSHPLLDELKRRAPGTMFHSMNVATLAEDAARAIGANPLKAKAGALFHDIGKLSNPGYFVENNVDSPAEHEQLPPRQSCSIIREHVTEGINLGRKYRLSRFIKDAISTHHGDDLVSFFYRKALENHENNPGSAPVVEADFRYTGNAPYGRELTIISLADACEAACRSIKNTTESNIREMVENIFIHRFKNNQLRASKLTLNELNIVRESFIKDLVNFNHGRIAYNKEKKHDPTQQPVVLPEQKSSEKK
jgi:putative nucleotidyltransferase with HDIG domain